MSNNYDVGYKKPPETGKFRKGRSGNPAGRPKKAKATVQTDADLLAAIEARLVTVNGKEMTMREVGLTQTVRKAAGGHLPSMKYLDAIRAKSPDTQKPRSVLVMPAKYDTAEEWAAACEEDQRKFREPREPGEYDEYK